MKFGHHIKTREILYVAVAACLLIAVLSCGIQEQDLLGPRAPVNPFIQAIAYGGYSGLGGLIIVNADGSQRRIVGADDSISSAMWSPDKQSVAYIRLRDFLPGHSLRVVRADGSSSMTVAEGVRGANLTPGCWSPGGKRLVFDGGPNNLIVISSSTGSLDFLLPNAIGGSFLTDSTLVCQLIENGNPDSTIVVHVNISSGLLLGTAHAPGGSYFLSRVSPSFDKVAYVFAPTGDFDKTNEIWIMNPDGSGKERLATGGLEYLQGRIRELRFSPDGSRLLFVPDWGNLTRVHVLDIATGNVQELPGALALPWARCDWSPQSDRIVFSHRNGGICWINDDGTGVARIDSLGEDPSW